MCKLQAKHRDQRRVFSLSQPSVFMRSPNITLNSIPLKGPYSCLYLSEATRCQPAFVYLCFDDTIMLRAWHPCPYQTNWTWRRAGREGSWHHNYLLSSLRLGSQTLNKGFFSPGDWWSWRQLQVHGIKHHLTGLCTCAVCLLEISHTNLGFHRS